MSATKAGEVGSSPSQAYDATFSIEAIINELNLILDECEHLLQHHATETVVVKAQCSKLLNGLQTNFHDW